MKIDRVIIDPGHGGILDGVYQTAGKRFTFDGPPSWTLYEGERQRVLAGFLADELVARGVAVLSSLTGEDPHAEGADPWTPEDVPLSRRVAVANGLPREERAGCLFLSLHSNAISKSSEGPGQTRATGIVVFTSEGETGSDPVATAIHRDAAGVGHLRARSQAYEDGDPDYEAGFYVLRRTYCRAVLLELGFHDNPDDAAVLADDEALRDYAIALADAIADFGAGAVS